MGVYVHRGYSKWGTAYHYGLRCLDGSTNAVSIVDFGSSAAGAMETETDGDLIYRGVTHAQTVADTGATAAAGTLHYGNIDDTAYSGVYFYVLGVSKGSGNWAAHYDSLLYQASGHWQIRYWDGTWYWPAMEGEAL